jgi:H+-translocating NAD(P) transhydrogenase subunit alpha
MTVTIAIPKEISPGESRVAMVPSMVDKFLKLGAQVKIQKDAGSGIFAADDAYKGAEIVGEAQSLFREADLIFKVQPPTSDEIKAMKEGAVLISHLYPQFRPEILKELCAKKITALALEMVPRISRAQSMDVQSSQATIIGYKAVLLAANQAKFFFPMSSTAAGTIRPATVLIIGAGVAGLQAIATAKRLGARVEAYDVRSATKQEVESLGAKFVDTGVKADAEGGYARELTEAEKKQQQEALAKHIANCDVLITTAGVPGKPAPKIVSQETIETMKSGAVIVDTMAEMGGNCALTKAGETVMHHGVAIVGTKNITSSLASPGSEMLVRNIFNFISPMFKEGKLNLNWQDEVISGSAATHEGKIVHESLKKYAGE